MTARGGTELMMERLEKSVSPFFFEKFQIIPSRVREIDSSKKQILWCHDLALDPEVALLKNGGWRQFEKIVFVSHWQQSQYHSLLGVPYDAGIVIEDRK